MPPEPQATPTRTEVEWQLARMMDNADFASRPQQAKLLAFIVNGTLDGEEITEKYIRGEFFPSPPYKPESNIARRTIDLIRDLLTEYYVYDGRDDLVIISLPQSPPGKRIKFQAGKAYTPLFGYNPRHPDSRKFRLGSHFLQQRSPTAISEALAHLHEVTALHGGHSPAHTGLVEALCTMTLYMSRSSPSVEILTLAGQIANDAVGLAPDDWYSHAVRGVVLLCADQLQQANHEFAKSLEHDRLQTLNYAWYHAFLFRTGKQNRALELAKLYAIDHVESPYAQALYGLYLYAMRRFKESDAALKAALKLDRNCWLPHLVLCVLHLSLERPDDAWSHYQRLQIVVGEEHGQWIMPGLAAICVSRAGNVSEEERDRTLRWCEELIAQIDEDQDWFQSALACLALGEPQKAVWALEHAYCEHHPLVLWLNTWPIFDPIRKRRDFLDILEKLNPSPRM